MTFGGAPYTKLSCWKSESLETIANPYSFAYVQIASSKARREIELAHMTGPRVEVIQGVDQTGG